MRLDIRNDVPAIFIGIAMGMVIFAAAMAIFASGVSNLLQ